MRVSRNLAYAMVPNEKRDKLDVKGTKCMFLAMDFAKVRRRIG